METSNKVYYDDEQSQTKDPYEVPQVTDLGMIKDKFEDSFDMEAY